MMRRSSTTDWPLLWSTIKNHAATLFLFPGIALVLGLIGGSIFIAGYGDLGAMTIGGFFALIGLPMFIVALVITRSSVSYYYDLALLRKHGVEVDGVLTKKEAQCQYQQEYDSNNNPVGDGYYLCDLYVDFDFQFNGYNHSGAFFLEKAELFDKLREGDPLPLKVLRLNPSVHKVRERRLANMLKDREPEHPSQIPEGAEISQLM